MPVSVLAEERPWSEYHRYYENGKTCVKYGRELTPSGRYRSFEIRDDCVENGRRITKGEVDCKEWKTRYINSPYDSGNWFRLDVQLHEKFVCE